MFPISIDGRIEVPNLTSDDVRLILTRVEEELVALRAVRVTRDGNVVSFRRAFVHLRSLWSWSILNAVSRGTIEVLPGAFGSVAYSFSTREMAVTWSAGVAAMLAFIGLSGGFAGFSPRQLLVFGGLLVFMWLWAVGGNYALTAARVPAFIKKATGLWGSGPRACPACGARYDPADYRVDAQERLCEICHAPLPASGPCPRPLT